MSHAQRQPNPYALVRDDDRAADPVARVIAEHDATVARVRHALTTAAYYAAVFVLLYLARLHAPEPIAGPTGIVLLAATVILVWQAPRRDRHP